MRVFVLTRGYPSQARIYNHGFVHRRVMEYRRRGVSVRVFWLREQPTLSSFIYDGVEVTVGNSANCLDAIKAFDPDAVAAHAPADDFGAVFEGIEGSRRVVAWIYGSEMVPFYKVTERPSDDFERWERARSTFARRISFWRRFLLRPRARFTVAFVSAYARRAAEAALGFAVEQAVVLPSPIDTGLFAFVSKAPEQRFEILSIRPFSDWRYANDLSVAAVLRLQAHPRFAEMRFRFIGSGRLFDRTLSPLRGLPNVICEEGMITQEEAAAAYRTAGIFLCPTRDDAQGVSRDEAMASGMVVATNSVAAVPEFADLDCAILANSEDATGLAVGIALMIDNPEMFLARSEAAALRIRDNISTDLIIPRELSLLFSRP